MVMHFAEGVSWDTRTCPSQSYCTEATGLGPAVLLGGGCSVRLLVFEAGTRSSFPSSGVQDHPAPSTLSSLTHSLCPTRVAIVPSASHCEKGQAGMEGGGTKALGAPGGPAAGTGKVRCAAGSDLGAA